MLTLIETVKMPVYRPVDRIRRLIDGGADITEDVSMGLRMLRIKIPEEENERVMERSARQAARRAARLGVGKTVYPKDFRYKAAFERLGAREPDALPLYRELASGICMLAAEMHGIRLRDAGAAIFAGRLTRQTEKAVLSLCGEVRHMSLLVERGADGFINALRRDMGVSVVGRRIDSLLAEADLILMFDRPQVHMPPAIKNDAVSVVLYGGAELPETANIYTGAELAVPADLKDSWPAGCDDRALAAALFEAGALRPEKLEIKKLVPSCVLKETRCFF